MPESTTDYRDPTPQSPVVFKSHGDISRPETVVVADEYLLVLDSRIVSEISLCTTEVGRQVVQAQPTVSNPNGCTPNQV